jgi:hypothetical protein
MHEQRAHANHQHLWWPKLEKATSCIDNVVYSGRRSHLYYPQQRRQRGADCNYSTISTVEVVTDCAIHCGALLVPESRFSLFGITDFPERICQNISDVLHSIEKERLPCSETYVSWCVFGVGCR